jgi:hypothetical protein
MIHLLAACVHSLRRSEDGNDHQDRAMVERTNSEHLWELVGTVSTVLPFHWYWRLPCDT